MRRKRWVGLLLLPLLAALPAFAGDGEDKVAEARRAIEPLVKGYQEARAEMQVRLTELKESEAFQKAVEAEDHAKVQELRAAITQPVMERWRKEFAAAQEGFAQSEGEVVFASAMIEQSLVEDLPALVVDTLEHYPKSALIGAVLDRAAMVARSGRKEEIHTLLGRVIAENPSVEMRAAAHYARATAVDYDENATDEDKARATEDRAQVIALLPEDALLSLRARGPEFEKTRLQIGMEAPDIAGVDIAGETFRLSDYRGKVVMLDFWGDW